MYGERAFTCARARARARLWVCTCERVDDIFCMFFAYANLVMFYYFRVLVVTATM